jgi:hypothetical protein
MILRRDIRCSSRASFAVGRRRKSSATIPGGNFRRPARRCGMKIQRNHSPVA